MRSSMRKVALTSVIGASLSLATFGLIPTCYSQSLRYMDSSGNLRFADSIKDVPREYREQIYPPTPTPVLTRQQQVQKQIEEERIQRQKMQRERMRQMERDRRSMEVERSTRKKRNELRQDEVSSGFQPGSF